MKIVTDLLTELGIDPYEAELGNAIVNGRNIRYLEAEGVIQISDDCFDRWANSLENEFEVWLPKGRRQFVRWVTGIDELKEKDQ